VRGGVPNALVQPLKDKFQTVADGFLIVVVIGRKSNLTPNANGTANESITIIMAPCQTAQLIHEQFDGGAGGVPI